MTTHICTSEELGLTDSKSENVSNGHFFPIHEKSVEVIKLYKKKLLCIDKEESTLFGDYNSLAARTITVQLKKCHGKVYCKSDEEINKFIRDKYLLMLNNQIRLDSSKYGAESIIMESRITWFRISTMARLEYPYRVQRTEILLQDEIANLDEITSLADSSLFKIVRQPTRPEERFSYMLMVISFEMDLNQYTVERSRYNILDLLSNVGGI